MSSSTIDPGDRSSAQIEREVESTRAELSDTLDSLRERVSPGHLMDQAVEYLRGSGGREFTSNLGRTVRDNPIPVLLIGAGMGWLMMQGGKSSDHAQGRVAATRVSSGTPGLPSRAGGSALHGSRGESHDPVSVSERARTAASGVAGQAGEMASQAYGRVADALGSGAEGVASTAEHVSQRASELGHEARDYAAQTARSAQEGMNRLMHEQPLVLGGIGLAIGAAIGAMLPGTDAENRVMGETSDDVARTVKDAAREGYERVQEVAGDTLAQAKAVATETYEATKERLDDAGLSRSKVGEALGSAAHDVAAAAKKGVHDAASGARDTMKPGGQPTKPV